MKRLTKDQFHDLACANSALDEIEEALDGLVLPADAVLRVGRHTMASLGCGWRKASSVDHIALGRAVIEAARNELTRQRDALRATLAPYIVLDDEAAL